jgi:hypothetical protein
LKVPEIGQVLELYTIFDFFFCRVAASSNNWMDWMAIPLAVHSHQLSFTLGENI